MRNMEEAEKLMAQMAQMAHAVQLNGMPQVHARLKELEEVIERPAARRRVRGGARRRSQQRA